MTQNYNTWSEEEKRNAYFALCAEVARLQREAFVEGCEWAASPVRGAAEAEEEALFRYIDVLTNTLS